VSRIVTLLAGLALTQAALSQIWEREDVGFDSIQSRARDLANRPYEAPNRDSLPGWMANLTYDQYRDIRFNPNQALWAADNLPFRAMFFHPGYLYREPVTLNEFTSSHSRRSVWRRRISTTVRWCRSTAICHRTVVSRASACTRSSTDRRCLTN
jgi:glucans biosynthesis protein